MPDLHPERPVAAWARGAEAARSTQASAEMPAARLLKGRAVVAVAFVVVVVAGTRAPADATAFELLVHSPRVIESGLKGPFWVKIGLLRGWEGVGRER